MFRVSLLSSGFFTTSVVLMVTENEVVGYTIAYDREEVQFPVYVLAFFAAVFFAIGVTKPSAVWLVVGLIPTAIVYYNFPLVETGRPRLGAGQYGLFFEGLGLIDWRAVANIETVETDMRGVGGLELHVTLRQPVATALIIDWRKRPVLRRGMRLPWKMKGPSLLRVPLDILDRPPAEIQEKLARMWRFYRGQT